jgi:hypothetical protein
MEKRKTVSEIQNAPVPKFPKMPLLIPTTATISLPNPPFPKPGL